MTVPELAVRLGISVHGCRNAIARGEIPGVLRLGRSVRVSRRVVDRWLDDPDNGSR